MEKWIEKFKQKGTQVVKIGNNYYLYQIKSVWDPQKKRAKKITEKYLGKITPDGLVKPKHERVVESFENISVKEIGASFMGLLLSEYIKELLCKYFPSEWKEILVFSFARLFNSLPIKNVMPFYSSSHLSDVISGAKVSPKSLSSLLFSIGNKRSKVVDFLKNFVTGTEFAVIDLTHIFSFSEDVITATIGHNSEGEYTPQINFVMIFSLNEKMPSFFRLVSGSIRDISVIPATIKEAGLETGIIIGDKGFYSANNVKFLEEKNLEYILPLKRSSSFIDYTPLGKSKKELDGYFIFDERVIWHYERKTEDEKRIIVFLDEKLRVEEEKDLLLYVDKGGADIDKYYAREKMFGSIAIMTKTNYSSQKVFELLKSRVEIEILFDTFKNILQADRTYLRNAVQIEGWMFVNFISLLIYYQIYNSLLKNEMLKKYSVKDIIMHLSRIYKAKIGDKWQIAEIPKQSKIVMDKLNLKIHIT